MNIPVVFVMPQEATTSLSQRLSLGDDGISEVTRSLCNVNVSQAEAFDPRDEKKVKDTIQHTVGFERVNQTCEKCHGAMDWCRGAREVSTFGE